MSSIGSLTTSTSTSIRGYGGLASGLDRDELIEGMTIGTTTKINKQEQKKQQIEWMQEAIQTISDKMIGFHGKYTETLTSPTNLFSSVLWGRNKITTSGAYASKVSVSGTANSADAITIMGVKQKAENAKWSTSTTVSDGKLTTGDINVTGLVGANGSTTSFKTADLEGTTLDFKFGSSSYSVTLSASDGRDYTTEAGIEKAVKDILSKQEISNGKKLSEVIDVKVSDGKITLKNVDPDKNNIELTGGTALDKLGLNKGLIKGEATGNFNIKDLYKEVDFAEYVGGKSLTFSYNGTSADVSILSKDELYKVAYRNAYKTDYKSAYDEAIAAGKTEAEAVKAGDDEVAGIVNKVYKDAYNAAIAADKTEEEAKQAGEEAKSAATQTAVEGAKGDMLTAIAKSLEKQLQSAFGKDRIKVTVDTDKENNTQKLSFKTMIPGEGEDTSSVLTLTGGSIALVGKTKGALSIQAGESTRLNLNAKIKDAGIKDLKEINGEIAFNLNGTTIKVKADATVKDLMNAINKSDANVTVSYQEAADKFTFESKDNGASGAIEFDPASKNLAEKLFGLELDGHEVYEIEGKDLYRTSEEGQTYYTDVNGNKLYKEGADGNLYKKDADTKEYENIGKKIEDSVKEKFSVRGKDAIVAVRYAGSDKTVEIRRDSNTFTIDGLTIGVKGTFGYKDGVLETNEENAVEISASVDTDKIIDTLKSFVEEYNAIVDMVNSELTTKHEKDYTPLSSEQKSELSDDEISKWETKAKAGLLYGDSDLRSLSMDLRTVATSYAWELQKVGINISSTYSDNGKLSIDETKLRSALETDPESVENLFAKKVGVDDEGAPIYNGIAANMKKVMEKYVKTTGAMQDKGILIRKAGSKSSALSMTDNTYYNQLSQIEKLITQLNDRLKSERDRYVKQFTSLETLISNMNSQASYLSSMTGY